MRSGVYNRRVQAIATPAILAQPAGSHSSCSGRGDGKTRAQPIRTIAQGVVGVAVGIGASLGTTLAGYVAVTFGDAVAFLFLGSVGAAGVLLVLALMPETRGARGASVRG